MKMKDMLAGVDSIKLNASLDPDDMLNALAETHLVVLVQKIVHVNFITPCQYYDTLSIL